MGTVLFIVDCSSSMGAHEDDIKVMLTACASHFWKYKTGLLAYSEKALQLFGTFLPQRSSVSKANIKKIKFGGQPDFSKASVHLKYLCGREKNVTLLHFTDGKTAYAVSTKNVLMEIGVRTFVISVDSTMPLNELYDFCPVYPYRHGILEILEKISSQRSWFRRLLDRFVSSK
jgi:uncharacterized protein YbgA (DUF1722 family)